MKILVAEDSRADVYLIREALALHWPDAEVMVIDDGEELMNVVSGPARPDICLFDINLPKRSGIDALEQIRSNPAMAGVPIIVMSSSDGAMERERAARLGADIYFRKPSDLDEFLNLGRIIREVWERRTLTGSEAGR